ncbi:lymphocyte antigen 6S-like [Mercenaria mercenaria]|uniref:lymphocyte antigen 6S-like n=1 Tax=Mercenaria mercenaria TaxID=6596 RepID=UPI00234EBB70|nr:lymphocyte antigen 6S-like [Mercenaria mercenaria]
MEYSDRIFDWVVPLLLLFLPFRGIQGLRCHECTGVTDPHHCSMVVHCAADEKCHTEKVIGENSAVFYNLGCQKIQLCHLAANGKRSDVDVCQGCCGTDLCNAELWCPASNSK